jgi:hypothetical protein
MALADHPRRRFMHRSRTRGGRVVGEGVAVVPRFSDRPGRDDLRAACGGACRPSRAEDGVVDPGGTRPVVPRSVERRATSPVLPPPRTPTALTMTCDRLRRAGRGAPGASEPTVAIVVGDRTCGPHQSTAIWTALPAPRARIQVAVRRQLRLTAKRVPAPRRRHRPEEHYHRGPPLNPPAPCTLALHPPPAPCTCPCFTGTLYPLHHLSSQNTLLRLQDPVALVRKDDELRRHA